MKYIPKGSTPAAITNYIADRKLLGLAVDYETFQGKEALNNVLRREQGQICCYCQQRIDHYNMLDEAGSHNEHLVPQNGRHGNHALQLDYNNIYACCNYTRQFANKADKYCGWHKEHALVAHFIQAPDCRNAFKYNVTGEILPNGRYNIEQEYTDNRASLPQGQADALNTIQTLNLNQTILVERRRSLITELIKMLAQQRPTKAQAERKVQQLIGTHPFPPFVEVVIYYLRRV